MTKIFTNKAIKISLEGADVKFTTFVFQTVMSNRISRLVVTATFKRSIRPAFIRGQYGLLTFYFTVKRLQV